LIEPDEDRMQDLRSQLASKLGRPAPEPTAPAAPPDPSDLLHPSAHLADPWLKRLLSLRGISGAPKVPNQPSLNGARQLTDQLAKLLKKGGRARDGKELKALRDKFLARRDKQAWSRVKEAFKQHGLSDRGYRSLKQGGADPVKALARLKKADHATLASLSAQRLRDELTR
jgi:hypothetical protein